MTGINAIMLYSNTMLENMSKSGSSITPRQGTIIIGTVNFLASATSVFSSRYFTRKFLFISGYLGMGIAHIAVGVSAYYNYPTLVLVFISIFILVF